MEITRRFIKFLEELEDPQVQEKYLNQELEDNLRTITAMISKLNLSDNQKPSSINDLQIFENTLSEGCHHIIKKLKETLEAISALHVYITNFPPNPFNIHRYLTAYCQAIFECASISFISPHVQAIKVMKIFNGQNILDMDTITKIVKELDGLMADKAMLALEGAPQGALGAFIEKKNSFGNIVVKLEKDNERFYLLMHFDKDSPFTGSFISGKYNEVFPSIFNILTGTLVSVVKNIYPSKMDPLLDSLESLKLELIELYKRYFLSYIATEIRHHLDCEVSTSIVIDQKEEEINSKLAKAEKKSIQMVLLNGNVLELKNNFHWDNVKLCQRLSSLWGKLRTSARAKEQRTFYHFSMQNTDHLFLEFNKTGNLVFQNKPVQQTVSLKSVVEVGDFLMEPKARSIDEILAQKPKLLDVVRSLIKETEESKSQTVAKKEDLPDVSFEFIGKRREGKKILEGFAIVFKDSQPPLRKRNSDPLDSLIDDLDNCSENYPLDPTFKKVKRLLSVRHVNPKKLLGEHADLSVLKKTIISEYLPEELTSNPDEPKAHKSIASVNKIKLDIISKTAFTESPMHKKYTTGKSFSSPFSQFAGPNRAAATSVSFTPESLVSRPSDRATLEDWSFDAINVEDPIEKNRLVWAMLDAFDLVKEFNIELNILCEFISRMKEKYSVNTNSFHNYEHGVTVMHGAFYILRHISTKFTNLVNLGILISTFCHDASHTGRTNIFEVNSGSKLALKYHDKSVLEQHHAAVTFKVLSKETCNIFSNIKGEDSKQLRKLIISNILATDMKNHFDVMNTFNDLRNRIEKTGEENFSWGDDDVTVVTNMVVHCSDLCGPTKSFPVAYHWAERINQEFSIQVREEEALGIPVTPYFRDLDKPHIMAKQEIAFISFMIKPLWESCNKFFGGAMQIAVDNIETNVKQWNVLLEDALKKKEAEDAAAAAAGQNQK